MALLDQPPAVRGHDGRAIPRLGSLDDQRERVLVAGPRGCPLQFSLADADVVEGTIDEVITQRLVGKVDQRASDLAARLKETRLVVTIRVGFGGGEVERAVWDMLSVVESCIARDHDGLVVAAEGVYDSQLNLLVGF